MVTPIQKPQSIILPGDRRLDFNIPLVMGILNITPDSFSDGARFLDAGRAVTHAKKLINEGADIVDIGGESSRPGSDPVPAEEELKRVIPVIKEIRQFSAVPISIDTTRAVVARQALEAGADLINDISAFRFDETMVEVAAEFGVPAILMHMLGTPKTMQVEPRYQDCISEIMQFFSERLHFCLNYGLPRDRVIIDPGIGFGKRLQDNLMIIRHLDQFKSFGCPVMVGASRKSFIAMATGLDRHPVQRLGGSLAAALAAVRNGADIVRVHDTAETVEAIKLYRALEGAD